MGAHAYRHLEQSAPMMRKLVCMYTIYLIWIDDAFVEDTSAIDAFNMRFVHGQEQNTRDLDDFAGLIREMAGYYDTVSANLFLTSTMNFVTSLTFEFQTQGMEVGFSSLFFCLDLILLFGRSIRGRTRSRRSRGSCRLFRRRIRFLSSRLISTSGITSRLCLI